MANVVEIEIRGDDQSRAAFNSLLKNVKKGTKQTGGMLAKFRDLAIVATAAKRGLQALGQQVKAGFADAVRQERAQATLAATLRSKVTPQWRAALAEINKFADGIQRTTAFSADSVREMARVGASFGASVEEIISAIPAILDKSIDAQRDALELTRLYFKSLSGVSEAWGELGLSVDKGATRIEKGTAAIAAMTSGSAKMIGSLATTAIAQFANELSDLRGLLVRVGVATGTFQLAVKTVTGWVSKLNRIIGDPAVFKAFVKALDEGTVFVINLGIEIARVAVLMTGMLLQGLEIALRSLVNLANAFGLNKVRIAELEARIEGYGNALGKSKVKVDEMKKATTATGRAYLRAKQELAFLHGEFSLGKDTVFAWAEAIGNAKLRADFFVRSMRTVADVIRDSLGLSLAPPETKDEEAEETEARLAEQLELYEQAGRKFGALISYGIQDSLDKDVGAREAMDRMGEDMRRTLIAHFSDAALAPIHKEFGLLATALAKPFELVGQVIGRALNMLFKPISDVIDYLIKEFLALITTSEVAGAAGAAGVAAVGVLAASLAGVWGAAATAAAIATLGFATTFAIPAQAAITTGAAIAKIASTPGAAEGAIVLPSPGGTLMQVAEAGEPEVISPLSKLPGLLGGGGGGDINIYLEGANISATGEEGVEGFFEEVSSRIMEARLLGNTGPGGLNL